MHGFVDAEVVGAGAGLADVFSVCLFGAHPFLRSWCLLLLAPHVWEICTPCWGAFGANT